MSHVTHVNVLYHTFNESCHIGTPVDVAMTEVVNESCRTCE